MKPSDIKRNGSLNEKLRNEKKTSPKEIKNNAPIELIDDPQKIEAELMENSGECHKLNRLLDQLDEVLERIPEHDCDLKRYLIEAVLRDKDPTFDEEAEGIIHKGEEIFGDYNQIMAAYSC
jgi:hypothetical protein